jgi:hypothetical protein
MISCAITVPNSQFRKYPLMRKYFNSHAVMVLIVCFAVAALSCSAFSVRENGSVGFFPTSIDLQNWVIESPVAVIDIQALPDYKKQYALEYRADEIVRSVFRHKDENSIITLELWHFTKNIDAFGVVSRIASDKNIRFDGNIYSSDIICLASKGSYAVFAEVSSAYLTSQGELLKGAGFILEKISAGKNTLPAFLKRENIYDIVYYREPRKEFFNISNYFRAVFLFEGSKIISYWAEFDSEEFAESAFSGIVKGSVNNTITDYSKDKKLFFQDETGFSGTIQHGKSVIMCRGLPTADSAQKCASALSGVLSL